MNGLRKRKKLIHAQLFVRQRKSILHVSMAVKHWKASHDHFYRRLDESQTCIVIES